MNSFNQPPLGGGVGGQQQFQTIACNNYGTAAANTGASIYIGQTQTHSPQTAVSTGAATSSLVTMQQQFASQSAANFVTFQSPANYNNTATVTTTINCLQKEIESLKKQNLELQSEVEKLRAAYTDINYQAMSANMKLGQVQEQLEVVHKEKCEQEKAFKELKGKYDEKLAIFKSPHQSEERSLLCDECNFEVKSQVALFIHKLNHHFESSIPRHLQLSTRSFSTMPDDSVRFKYKCHCCEIDSARDFARHEIYVHIYQFHTFDVPFKCKFCFLYFTSKSYLNDHLVEKHSVTSGRQGKKRKSAAAGSGGQNCSSTLNGAELKQGCLKMEQLNSTLQLNSRVDGSGGEMINNNKRPKTLSSNQSSGHQHPHQIIEVEANSADINELFQQLVGSGEGHQSLEDHLVHQQPQSSVQHQASTEFHHHHNKDVLQQVSRSNSISSSSTTTPTTTPSAAPNTESLQQIMLDLDGDDSLNCKYPGCKFTATTKNHLKFHISAHLMSKYKCPYCTFVGNRVIEIKRHILKSSKHSDQHVFLCPDCDFASDCEKTFREHYSRMHNAQVDVGVVIERLFLNESNKVGQNMLLKSGGGSG